MTHPIINIIVSKQGVLCAAQQLVGTAIPHSLSALSPNCGLTSKPTMIGFLAHTFTEGLHRIVEQARLEGNPKDHLVQPFMWNRASMKSFSILFKTSNNGDYHIYGEVVQWMMVLTVRNILLLDKYEHIDIIDKKNPIWSESIHSYIPIYYIT